MTMVPLKRSGAAAFLESISWLQRALLMCDVKRICCNFAELYMHRAPSTESAWTGRADRDSHNCFSYSQLRSLSSQAPCTPACISSEVLWTQSDWTLSDLWDMATQVPLTQHRTTDSAMHLRTSRSLRAVRQRPGYQRLQPAFLLSRT